MSFFYFDKYDNESVKALFSVREGEEKIGQKIGVYSKEEDLKGKFVILGVAEDVGPRANLGFAGADTGFNAFVTRFLNVQSNRFLVGSEVVLFGVVRCKDLVETTKDVLDLRKVVEQLDVFLQDILQGIFQLGGIPIVIGGGHNNAYPIIKAYSIVNQKKIDVLNIDPHADFRKLEGRHSGNSFSYGMHEGYIGKYSILGLHESYNSESMLKDLEKSGVEFTFFEDYIDERETFFQDLFKFQNKNIGLEIDMDAIKQMPSSAYTPSGFSVEEVRRAIRFLASNSKVLYLHLPEAAPQNEREATFVGKVIAYLVTDFIKKYSKTKVS
jgi:formiminoglutamase